MAAPPPPNHHTHHHHHLHSSLPPIAFRPCGCGCCCCFSVRCTLLHHQQHHFHHQLFHPQHLPPWTPHGSPPFLVPRPGVCPPPTLSHRGCQCGVTPPDAVQAGQPLVSSEDVSSNRLQEQTSAENFENVFGEGGGGGGGGGGEEEEEEEAVYVLTDEWAEFFAKSEAKRQLERKQKKQQQKGSTR